MKRTPLLFILLISFLGFGQPSKYFNGMIKHKHSYKSDKYKADSIAKNKSKGDVYYFHDNMYQGITFTEENKLIYTYDSERNSCLGYNLKQSNISCQDYSINTGDTLIKSYKKKGSFNINGVECELIVLEYPNITYHEYVTDGFFIDPKLYLNHQAFDFVSKMKATNGRVSIRTEIVMKDYTMIIDMIEFKESKEPLTNLGQFDEWWKLCGDSKSIPE
ncbi:hypothetical protein [Aquimarina spinulae]|uniref:hypothetical protein n=1 Tax=Aquimarina spinulae TaxID=1192023 RepID=UPI000D54CB40|nr:hypothetical protein [Aquimarina spinulae]